MIHRTMSERSTSELRPAPLRKMMLVLYNNEWDLAQLVKHLPEVHEQNERTTSMEPFFKGHAFLSVLTSAPQQV